ERDRLMSEIALRARLRSLPPMLAKARTLLTRFWGRASWEARSEILAVARMLMALGAAQPALQAQPRQAQSGVPEKRQARTRRAPGRQKAAQAPRKMAGDDDPT